MGVRDGWPYYEESGIRIFHARCEDVLPTLPTDRAIVTDPPYNVGYHYEGYMDKMDDGEYLRMLAEIVSDHPSVLIHYPESLFSLSMTLGVAPRKCAAWTYNANTPKQWRMAAWFNWDPDFTLMRQPYKNPEDRRIAQRILNGEEGGRLYDWWNINQVKNVSEGKYDHPCQIPLQVMSNILGVSAFTSVIVDPFAGSGTTAVACKAMGLQCTLIEREEKYCEIAVERLRQSVFDFTQ